VTVLHPLFAAPENVNNGPHLSAALDVPLSDGDGHCVTCISAKM
jgi:hypothetical protein